MFALFRSIGGPFLREGRRPLLLYATGIAAVTFTAAAHVGTPWLVGRFIDAAPRADVAGLRTAAIGLFVIAVLASIGGATRALVGRRLADLFRAHLRVRLMRQLLRLPLSDIEGGRSRQMNSVFIDDVPAIANMANPMALNVFLALIQLAAALTLLTILYPGFAWLVLLVVPLNAVIALWQWPLARARARELQQNKTRLDTFTIELVEGARDIKGLAAERSLLSQLAACTAADLRARWRSYVVGTVDHARYSGTWLLMSTVYFVGGMAVARGELTIGSLTAFIFYVGFLETPISRLWQSATDWQNTLPALERYSRVVGLPPETEGSLSLDRKTEPEIEFRGVTFQYPGSSEPALADVRLRFVPGQQVAIVGASGAGKTTLVSLILRLFDPEEGAVLIGGSDIRDCTLESLRRYVAVISQDPFIFDGSVRDNIIVGLDACSDADVRQAAQVADADGFIRALPDGYDTLLGARGARLSGGQKRRIAIARAIARHPRILVLDEVTGALDSVSDLAIRRAIQQIGRDCTIVTVSHRLSSTAQADQIVVLEQGRVIGTGTHQTLLRECPSYQTLAALQQLEHSGRELCA